VSLECSADIESPFPFHSFWSDTSAAALFCNLFSAALVDYETFPAME
jgi:hypothetical protein